jgi:uncharacterized protein
LESKLAAYEKETGNEIAIALVKSLNEEPVEDAAVNLFAQWKIGKKGKDTGVLILAAIEDRKVRLEVGYGLEPKLTDARAGEIIRNEIAPAFKQGKYSEGLDAAITKIQQVVNSPESLGTRVDNNPGLKEMASFFLGLGFFAWFLIPLAIYLAAFLGRSKRIWPGGLAGLVIGALIGTIFSLTVSIILAFSLGILGLLLDWILSANYERLKTLGKNTGWAKSWGGFWAGTGHGGSGGFGGFSGGSSGGGGASGSW